MFIELTASNTLIMINIERICLIHKTIHLRDDCQTEIHFAGDDSDVLYVKESYEEIKNIIKEIKYERI